MSHTGDRLTELLDREAIRDALFIYCRGIDRADEASLRRAYWPDATDEHGAAFRGSAEGFIDFALQAFKAGPRNIHQVSNILIEFQGPTRAAVESYFSALQRAPGKDGVPVQVMLAGRYCDLFEKRGDEWRVLARVVVYDWVEPGQPPSGSEAERFGTRTPIGGSFPDDPVYHIGKAAGCA